MDFRTEIRKILEEAFKDDHYIERLYDRFLDQSVLTVGYEIPGSVGEYEEVGTYVLPESIKSQILQNARLVENYNFPKGKSYGIQLGAIPIDKNLVDYVTPELKEIAKKHTLLFLDRRTQSNGNLVYAIVRDNKIITVYFAKNYVPQDAQKLKVDGIIKNMDAIIQKKVR
jgi:hypothetical protein